MAGTQALGNARRSLGSRTIQPALLPPAETAEAGRRPTTGGTDSRAGCQAGEAVAGAAPRLLAPEGASRQALRGEGRRDLSRQMLGGWGRPQAARRAAGGGGSPGSRLRRCCASGDSAPPAARLPVLLAGYVLAGTARPTRAERAAPGRGLCQRLSSTPSPTALCPVEPPGWLGSPRPAPPACS